MIIKSAVFLLGLLAVSMPCFAKSSTTGGIQFADTVDHPLEAKISHEMAIGVVVHYLQIAMPKARLSTGLSESHLFWGRDIQISVCGIPLLPDHVYVQVIARTENLNSSGESKGAYVGLVDGDTGEYLWPVIECYFRSEFDPDNHVAPHE